MSDFRGHDDHPSPVEGCALCTRLLRAAEPPLPGLFRMTVNYAASTVRHLLAGSPQTPEPVVRRRLSLCLVCDSYRQSDGRCGVVDGTGCGCVVRDKVLRAGDRCPRGKWGAV